MSYLKEENSRAPAALFDELPDCDACINTRTVTTTSVLFEPNDDGNEKLAFPPLVLELNHHGRSLDGFDDELDTNEGNNNTQRPVVGAGFPPNTLGRYAYPSNE